MFFTILLILSLTTTRALSDSNNTIITSQKVEINNDEEHILFLFKKDVCIKNNNFELFSDILEVFCQKVDGVFNIDFYHPVIDKIYASGNVKFFYYDRSGRADEIIVVPKEEIMYLVGNAEITNKDGCVCGDRLFLDRNSKSLKINSKGRSMLSIPDKDAPLDFLLKKSKHLKFDSDQK